MRCGATLVVDMQVKLAQNVNTVHPCVLARLEICPQLPTLVFYGHYDVFYVDDDVRAPLLLPPPCGLGSPDVLLRTWETCVCVTAL